MNSSLEVFTFTKAIYRGSLGYCNLTVKSLSEKRDSLLKANWEESYISYLPVKLGKAYVQPLDWTLCLAMYLQFFESIVWPEKRCLLMNFVALH